MYRAEWAFCWKEAVAVQVDKGSTHQSHTDATASTSIRRITFHLGVESGSHPPASQAFAEYYRRSLKEAINQANTICCRRNNVRGRRSAPCCRTVSSFVLGRLDLCVVGCELSGPPCVCGAPPTLAPASSLIPAASWCSSSCNRLALLFLFPHWVWLRQLQILHKATVTSLEDRPSAIANANWKRVV